MSAPLAPLADFITAPPSFFPDCKVNSSKYVTTLYLKYIINGYVNHKRTRKLQLNYHQPLSAAMAPLKFTNYPGIGETNSRLYSYSQSVRIGPTIKCSGQGGWDDSGEIVEGDITGQIQLAFENVEKNIKEAGGEGWANVYSVRSYHIDLDKSFGVMVEKFKRWMPDHRPVWTCVEVTRLGISGMEVEIEVEAYVQ